MNLYEAATKWADSGCSVVPPRQDGSKAPLGEWKNFQQEQPSYSQLREWFKDDTRTGIGIVCGEVSGNLEMLELEGRATSSVHLDAIFWEAQARGVEQVLQSLMQDGYGEWTPSGGIHFLYRVDGAAVPGNKKVARRPATEEELAENPQDKIKVLAETRGEGGYVIVAPSHGTVHPCGDSWSTFSGEIGKIPTLSQQDRDKLHEAIHAALDQMPPPAPAPPVRQAPTLPTGDRPGDRFNAATSWHDILLHRGWQWLYHSGDKWHLRRPGKNTGVSATISDTTDRLWVFSSSTEFEPEHHYSRFEAYTLLEHHGDFAAAARELGRRGYGDRAVPQAPAQLGVLQVDERAQARADALAASFQAAGVTAAPSVDSQATVVRNILVANEDRLFVRDNLTKELVSHWDRTRLFNYGGVICERDGTNMIPATRAVLDSITMETCQVVKREFDGRRKEGNQERFVPAPIETRMLDVVMSRPKEFSRLDKLSQIPFMRPDGTVCAKPGYDETTHTFLELDNGLSGIDIPEEPTKDQVAWARQLLLEDLLGDFPLHTESDKANALATLITPFIRDLIPTSPLAIIDAKEAGSGKNLLADIISILTTGKAAQTLPYTTDDTEQRKVITSAFRSGNAMLLFDEAHEIEGASFARALTSHSYQDRILGASNMAEFPNNRTWISLGNQVQIKGDMARRVYRVRLEYPGARPESREAVEFRHPDLRQWATDNRHDLVKACLILVRAWFALGKPAAKLPFRMGSFERWQETLAGILWVGGVEGFLENVPQWRDESDFERQHQESHLRWLSANLGEGEFTSAQVTDLLKRDRAGEHMPGMEDPFLEGYARRLGQAYARLKDRVLGQFQLIKMQESGHNNVVKWRVSRWEEPNDTGT